MLFITDNYKFCMGNFSYSVRPIISVLLSLNRALDFIISTHIYIYNVDCIYYGVIMKSRELNTIPDLIVSNYKIISNGDGKFTHSFTPENTDTVYKFVANGTAEVEEGQHYNIGYYTNENNEKIIELSCLAKIKDVNPKLSHLFAAQEAQGKHAVNKAKNDTRVQHDATDGYYWGKKYAWREFGMVIPHGAFYAYLEEIGHPTISCVTSNPDLQYQNNSESIAYKEEGLENAIERLITSAKKVTAARFESPLYSKRFVIKGIAAVTDRK